MKRNFDLTNRAVELAKELRLTYREALAELGRRGAAVRARKNLRIKNHGRLLAAKGLS